MGQQQLLLLVMGIIIVGVAVMAGLFAVQDQLQKSQADNIVSRNLEIASSAVMWKTKRDPYAGGNQSYSGLNTNGFAELFMDSETDDAYYALNSPSILELEITGVAKRYPNIGARTYVNDYDVLLTDVKYNGTYTIPTP